MFTFGWNLRSRCPGRRSSDRDMARLLQMSMGSARKLEYELLLAQELELLGSRGLQELAERTTEDKRMLASLIRRLESGADRWMLTADRSRRSRPPIWLRLRRAVPLYY